MKYIYMQKEQICFRWISAVVELSASDRKISGSAPGSATIEKKNQIL